MARDACRLGRFARGWASENQSTAKREERQRRCFFSSRSARRRGKRRAGSPSTARGGIRGADGSGDDAPGSARHRKRNFGRGSGGDSPTAGAVSTVVDDRPRRPWACGDRRCGDGWVAALGALDGALELARAQISAKVGAPAAAGCGEDRRGGDGFISDGTGVRARRCIGRFLRSSGVLSPEEKSHPGALDAGNPRRRRGRPTRTDPGFDGEQRGERVAR